MLLNNCRAIFAHRSDYFACLDRSAWGMEASEINIKPQRVIALKHYLLELVSLVQDALYRAAPLP